MFNYRFYYLNISCPKKDVVTGEWRKLHNEELSARGKIEKNEMGRACGTYGGGERCAQGSGGKT
jgi:hypothetical protein